MKKIPLLLILALVSAFVLSNFSTVARNTTIAERFAVAGKISPAEVAGTYNFDKNHTSIGFRVKHMGLVDIPGYFRNFSGTINYDAKDVSKSTIEFMAKATSIDTGVGRRDDHLRTSDFFDVEKHPEITFKSTKLEKRGDKWMMTGDLTIRGVTKQIAFPFSVVGFVPGDKGAMRVGATAETTINRKDFGVNYGGNLPNGTPVISDDIKIVLNIEAIMPAAVKADK